MILQPFSDNTSVPFPQANDLYKVIKYVDLLVEGYHQKSLINVKIEITPRQVSYYRAAARFLRLIDDNGATEIADFLFKCDRPLLLSGMVKLILDNSVFFEYFWSKDKERVLPMIKEIYGINETTANRRFSTLENWVKWCEIIIEENELEVIVRGYK